MPRWRRGLLTLLAALSMGLLGGCAPGLDPVDDAVAEPAVAATTSPSPGQAPATTPPVRRQVSMVMGGDLLWHNTVWYSAAADHRRTGRGTAYDFDPMFAALRPLIRSADVAICHEEVPFTAPGQAPESYPVFAAPRQIAPWIGAMGWDACTTASNHSWDQGFAGLVTTANLLERAGVAHVGTFRTRAERRAPVIVTTREGVRVGIVAATYGLNGFVVPSAQWWAVSQTTDPRDDLLRQARRTKRAGADIVVAHVHWGAEYSHLPTADQVALAERLTASPDVDVVLGEHAHVVQPITKVNGKWVAYGLGNMVAQGEPTRPATYEGITVRLDFVERPAGGWRVKRAAYVPTQWNLYSSARPIRIVDATGSHLASIRRAVHGLGDNRGLRELTLKRAVVAPD